MFQLDDQLAKDCHLITAWPLSQVLLMDDRRYPWLILVPAKPGLCEPFDLNANDQQQLWREAAVVGDFMKTRFRADKMNIAALGNVVSQLHVHVIARRRNDASFPSPVWGVGQGERYAEQERAALLAWLSEALSGLTP